MSYFIQAPFMVITTIAFLIVILLDVNPNRIKTISVFTSGVFGIFCAVILVASALYISFTPVGCTTVYGCQFRYLTPLVFPFTYLACVNLKNRKSIINKNVLTLGSVLFMVVTFMVWTGGVLHVTYSTFFGA